MKRRIAVFLLMIIVAAISGYYGLQQQREAEASTSTELQKSSPSVDATKNIPGKVFDKSLFSINDPESIWVITNKKRPLQPKTYVPADLTVPDVRLRSNITTDERQLRKIVGEALATLFSAAKTENIQLTLESGYRSYGFQHNLYNRYVSQQGQEVADTQSARPGHSEHQTGLAVDIGGISRPSCNVESCFSETLEGKWLAANAHKYGFIIRYPENKTPVTGYIYEPWHIRFVGAELATEMRGTGVDTMEEFFELPAAPVYN